MKKLLFMPIVLIILILVSCKEKAENRLEAFIDQLNEAQSYTVEFSAKRDFFPKYDYEGRIVYDSNLIYAYLNTDILDYGNEVYVDNTEADTVEIYYKSYDEFIVKSLSKESFSLSLDIKLDASDFVENDEGSYILINDNAFNILGIEFKDTVVTITEAGADLKTYYLYQGEVEIPIYISILNINSSEVVLPTL